MHISDHVLRCFLALADTSHFTSAAERCHLTQSALSQLISRLEERVGVSLFNRDSRSVSLTPEGQRFAESTRRVVKELDLALNDLLDIATLQAGYVSLAAVPSLSVMWLPKVLRHFHSEHPAIRLQLHDESSIDCHELVRQGTVDFALNSQPSSLNEMRAEILFEEALYLVCPVEHPISKLKVASAKDLAGIRFLHLKGTEKLIVCTSEGQRAARNVLHEAGVVDTGFEVNNMVTLAGLTAAGLGVCLAPETSLPLFSLLPTIAVKISPRLMKRQIFLVHQKGRVLSHAAQKMREFLLDKQNLQKFGDPHGELSSEK